MDKETADKLLKMKLMDFFKSYPGGVSLFKKNNMGCIGCSGVLSETVETSCLMHGISAEELLKNLPEDSKRGKL
jgi:hybrid cluster-associated redox disulfide protein